MRMVLRPRTGNDAYRFWLLPPPLSNTSKRWGHTIVSVWEWLEGRLGERRPRLWATYTLKHIHDWSWPAKIDPFPFRTWRGYVLDLSAAIVERRNGGRYVEGSVPAIDVLHKGMPRVMMWAGTYVIYVIGRRMRGRRYRNSAGRRVAWFI